jgi:hypothetical protein
MAASRYGRASGPVAPHTFVGGAIEVPVGGPRQFFFDDSLGTVALRRRIEVRDRKRRPEVLWLQARAFSRLAPERERLRERDAGAEAISCNRVGCVDRLG